MKEYLKVPSPSHCLGNLRMTSIVAVSAQKSSPVAVCVFAGFAYNMACAQYRYNFSRSTVRSQLAAKSCPPLLAAELVSLNNNVYKWLQLVIGAQQLYVNATPGPGEEEGDRVVLGKYALCRAFVLCYLKALPCSQSGAHKTASSPASRTTIKGTRRRSVHLEPLIFTALHSHSLLTLVDVNNSIPRETKKSEIFVSRLFYRTVVTFNQ